MGSLPEDILSKGVSLSLGYQFLSVPREVDCEGKDPFS